MPQSTHIADRVSRAKIVRADDDGGHAGGHAHRTRAPATLTLPQQPRPGAPDAAGYGDRPALLARGRPLRPAHGRGAQREADRPPARVTPVTACRGPDPSRSPVRDRRLLPPPPRRPLPGDRARLGTVGPAAPARRPARGPDRTRARELRAA